MKTFLFNNYRTIVIMSVFSLSRSPDARLSIAQRISSNRFSTGRRAATISNFTALAAYYGFFALAWWTDLQLMHFTWPCVCAACLCVLNMSKRCCHVSAVYRAKSNYLSVQHGIFLANLTFQDSETINLKEYIL